MSRLFQKHVQVRLVSYSLLVAAVIVGFVLAGYFYYKSEQGDIPMLARIRADRQDLKYTNPLIVTDLIDKKQLTEYKPLEKKINDYIAQAKALGSAKDVGAYYREFIGGNWTGVNEDALFAPGSLQKVPLMVAYYKIAETAPAILNDKLPNTMQGDANTAQAVKPAKTIEYGQEASVLDLLKLMIGYSDNNATNVLFNHLDQDSLKEVFSDLNLAFNDPSAHTNSISPKQYSLFFRVLYNASYLSWAYSEQALSLLTQSDFKDGLAAGVPQGVEVAHKFGESYNQAEIKNGITPLEQFHDCGVVYYPRHPYILCVMTRGEGLQPLEKVIQDISRLVYQDAESRYH